MIMMAKWYLEKCGLNILTFVLQLRETPGKTSTKKLTRPEFEPGLAECEATTLPLDNSGGHVMRCTMFLKLHFLNCHLDCFTKYIGAISDEHGEMLHQ